MCLRICVFKLRNILLLKKIDTFCSHCCGLPALAWFCFLSFLISVADINDHFFYFHFFERISCAQASLYHRMYWGLTSCCSSQLSSFLLCFKICMYDEDVEYTSCGHIFEIKINIFLKFFYYPAMGVGNWEANERCY